MAGASISRERRSMACEHGRSLHKSWTLGVWHNCIGSGRDAKPEWMVKSQGGEYFSKSIQGLKRWILHACMVFIRFLASFSAFAASAASASAASASVASASAPPPQLRRPSCLCRPSCFRCLSCFRQLSPPQDSNMRVDVRWIRGGFEVNVRWMNSKHCGQRFFREGGNVRSMTISGDAR